MTKRASDPISHTVLSAASRLALVCAPPLPVTKGVGDSGLSHRCQVRHINNYALHLPVPSKIKSLNNTHFVSKALESFYVFSHKRRYSDNCNERYTLTPNAQYYEHLWAVEALWQSYNARFHLCLLSLLHICVCSYLLNLFCLGKKKTKEILRRVPKAIVLKERRSNFRSNREYLWVALRSSPRLGAHWSAVK